MSVENRYGSYDDETIAIMAHAIGIARDQAAADGRAEDADALQARLARTIMAIVHEGERDPEVIAKTALERLTIATDDTVSTQPSRDLLSATAQGLGTHAGQDSLTLSESDRNSGLGATP